MYKDTEQNSMGKTLCVCVCVSERTWVVGVQEELLDVKLERQAGRGGYKLGLYPDINGKK